MYCLSSSRALARNPLDILIEKEEKAEGYVAPKMYVGIEQETQNIIVMGTPKGVKKAINARVKQIKLVDDFVLIKKG